MAEKTPGIVDVLEVVTTVSEATISGLLELIFALAQKKLLDDNDIKTIADAVTSKVSAASVPSAHQLFQTLLPGYTPPGPKR